MKVWISRGYGESSETVSEDNACFVVVLDEALFTTVEHRRKVVEGMSEGIREVFFEGRAELVEEHDLPADEWAAVRNDLLDSEDGWTVRDWSAERMDAVMIHPPGVCVPGLCRMIVSVGGLVWWSDEPGVGDVTTTHFDPDDVRAAVEVLR